MSFRNRIPGAFGTVDKKFAGHPCDMARAIELLQACVSEGIGLREFLVAIEDYLRREGCGDEHVKEQLSQVKQKFSGWLT